MPRIGAEPERKQALIEAAVVMIGEQGSLDVSVKDIARQAGMSPALAFHYFGGKDEIIVETMRHLLREFSIAVRDGLRKAGSPRGRIDAILAASFAEDQFERHSIAAWLVFYLKAYSSPQAARLLSVYTARLHSNLAAAFRVAGCAGSPGQNAEMVGAMIDGIYIRHALRKAGPDPRAAIADCRRLVDALCLPENSKIN